MKIQSKTEVLKREAENWTTAVKKLFIPDDGGRLFPCHSDFKEFLL